MYPELEEHPDESFIQLEVRRVEVDKWADIISAVMGGLTELVKPETINAFTGLVNGASQVDESQAVAQMEAQNIAQQQAAAAHAQKTAEELIKKQKTEAEAAQKIAAEKKVRLLHISNKTISEIKVQIVQII